MANETWAVGDAYQRYIGRWSTPVAEEFVGWLSVARQRTWLDVGCGTGALTAAVLRLAEPAHVTGIDPSADFLVTARAQLADGRTAWHTGDARSLPVPDHSFDAVVSGLAINFVPDPSQAVREFARAVRPAGVAAAYVWDYADGMALIRHFWDAARALDQAAAHLDEAVRFPGCRPESLEALWRDAGFTDVATRAIDVPTTFADFDDYWQPFLGGQGPAPGYVASLPPDRRDALRELLRTRLPTAPDGAIHLIARAWAVKGRA